jgi:hypothetical protein
MSIPVARLRSLLAVGAAAALGLAVTVPAAKADVLSLGGSSCNYQQLEQPFAQFGDDADYALVPGGSFESGGPAWTTAGGASLVADNEPWGAGVQAMSLPSGSSVTSPATCVSLDTPTLRFFANSSGDDDSSALQVSVLFNNSAGGLSSLPIGAVTPSGAWEPTLPYAIGVNLLSLLGGDYSAVAFQFTPQGADSWEIDDVYVDPWSKG